MIIAKEKFWGPNGPKMSVIKNLFINQEKTDYLFCGKYHNVAVSEQLIGLKLKKLQNVVLAMDQAMDVCFTTNVTHEFFYHSVYSHLYVLWLEKGSPSRV